MIKQQYEIKKGKTLIEVPHESGTITFVYEQHGPGTYAKVASSIEKTDLVCPTMAEVASLVYPAFFAGEEEFSVIRTILNNNRLWAFTGTLYTPNGIYIQDNPKIEDGALFMEESELVKGLEDDDPSIRFVPFGFKIGEMRPSKLAKNPYVIALAGEEGAEKLARVADGYKHNPYLWGFKSVDYIHPLPRISYVDRYSYLGGFIYNGLNVASTLDCYKEGCAFGIQKTNGTNREKKELFKQNKYKEEFQSFLT